MPSRLDVAVDAAREAGRFQVENVGKIRSIEDKDAAGKNLVTEIDKKSEEMIVGRIRRDFPGDEFLGEEGGHRKTAGAEFRWIIDPLDGTTNYTHGFPVYCVSIGVERGGIVEAGVIYDPNLDELFTAERGKGTALNGKQVKVSKISSIERSLLVTGFPYDIGNNPDYAIERFVGALMKAQAIRRMGSAAIDLAYVACGRYEGFWEVGLQPWDTAAGALMVSEAGGRLTGFRGQPVSIYDNDIVASNGLVHDQLISAISVPAPRD